MHKHLDYMDYYIIGIFSKATLVVALGLASVMSRFCVKGGQLGPGACHVTFFAPKEVSWGHASVMSHFCTKGGRCIC